MHGPTPKKIHEELARLMREQVESLANRTYLGITPEELNLERKRLQRIREVSADYLEVLKALSRPSGEKQP
ncbi:MAG: hypothetical protein ABSF97_10015 [Candidatus Sulfotelmatobacter sp.]|jgi:hypothetical protein